MNTEKLIELIKQLKENYEIGEKYLDSIPSDIRATFYENEYVNSLYKIQNDLLNVLIEDKFLNDEIRTFIFDNANCYPYYVDGKRIDSEEEFYQFIRDNYKNIDAEILENAKRYLIIKNDFILYKPPNYDGADYGRFDLYERHENNNLDEFLDNWFKTTNFYTQREYDYEVNNETDV